METNQIVAALDNEIARLREARALLSGNANGARKARPRRRALSAEARKKIVEAQKRRWARVKKEAK